MFRIKAVEDDAFINEAVEDDAFINEAVEDDAFSIVVLRAGPWGAPRVR